MVGSIYLANILSGPVSPPGIISLLRASIFTISLSISSRVLVSTFNSLSPPINPYILLILVRPDPEPLVIFRTFFLGIYILLLGVASVNPVELVLLIILDIVVLRSKRICEDVPSAEIKVLSLALDIIISALGPILLLILVIKLDVTEIRASSFSEIIALSAIILLIIVVAADEEE